MKKYLIKKAGLLLLGITLLSGCDKFLEENPDNRVDLNTVDKAAQLLTNAYSSASYAFTEWMSDNVSLTTGTFFLPEYEQAYRWEEITSINQDTPPYFWNATYDAIAHANEVLAVIDNLDGEADHKNAVKGEALLARAYGHFMLVNLFALHYTEDEADEDGIPYVTEPETVFIKKYTRHSIEDVYEKIEDDLEDGLELVDDSFYANSGKYHFTRNAGLALASRFYLFMGDYEKCIEYSSMMLGNDPDIFVKDIRTYLESYSDPQEFLRLFTSPSDPSNLLLIRQVTNTHVNVGYWPSPDLARSIFNENPWFADDIRISNRYPIFVRGNQQFWAFGKTEFLFERSSLTSNVGLNYTIAPVFRGEEVLLNRAEAYANENSISAALADLQVIVNKRYDGNPVVDIDQLRSYYGISNSRNAIIEFIKRERRKEFIHEGLRWFDIKRYEIRVRHALEDGTETLRENDDRKVLQIPQAAIDVGGLKPNPR